MRIFGLILAGGVGRRMGGADKALLPFGPGTLLSNAVARFEPQVEALALSANGDPGRFHDPALPILRDAGGAGRGPMAGLLAGLDWLAAQDGSHLATMAVDTPFIPGDLVVRLVLAAEGGHGAAIAECGGRAHPTAGLWPVGLRAALRSALGRGDRRLGRWAEEIGARRAPFPTGTPDPFFNINSREDLAAAEGFLD